MIIKLLFLSLFIFGMAIEFNAQRKLKLADCRKTVVQDPDRRGFNDSASFGIDVDDDGKPDTFTPRIYTVRTTRKVSGRIKPKAGETHWIVFDLKTSKGRVINSFFKYSYGTDRANYWVYAIVPCRVNSDGRTDLLFYSGDDTSQESIILVNRRNRFKVFSRKVEELSDL